MVDPHNTEHERKFLLTDDPTLSSEGTSIIQGYLPSSGDLSVRVRLYPTISVYQLTIKGLRKGISRYEEEEPIRRTMAEGLLQACGSRVIEKHRYPALGPDGKGWDVDVFHGANTGLRLAEIELGRPDEEFELPHWCGQEVTDDLRYYNEYLADHPYESWPAE